MPPKVYQGRIPLCQARQERSNLRDQDDKLADITVAPDELRDALLAKFNPDDVKRLEMHHGSHDLVLVKVKDNDKENGVSRSRARRTADTKLVEEVLKQIASLEAHGRTFTTTIDLKTVGLDKPVGRIKITLEEPTGRQKPTTRTLPRDERNRLSARHEGEGSRQALRQSRCLAARQSSSCELWNW